MTKPPREKAAVVLLSGGMDSTVALFDTIHNSSFIHVGALFFTYNQRNVRFERSAVMSVLDHACKFRPVDFYTIALPMPHIGLSGADPLAKFDPSNVSKEQIEKASDNWFVPHRNLAFLTFAAIYARRRKTTHIITGCRGGFSDCTLHFENEVEELLALSDKSWQFTIHGPCHQPRHETIKNACKLPGCWEAIGFSRSCFDNSELPCGRCAACINRAAGFREAGLVDPATIRA